jgi:hypothetical protein
MKLQHLVDTTLMLEGEGQDVRIFSTKKNRFGPCTIMAFDMTPQGLVPTNLDEPEDKEDPSASDEDDEDSEDEPDEDDEKTARGPKRRKRQSSTKEVRPVINLDLSDENKLF